MSNIPPTIGRRIWYWPTGHEGATRCADEQPFDAGVVFVWGPNCVNLDVTDHVGMHFPRNSVVISDSRQSGCAQWMPRQIGQAKYDREQGTKDVSASENAAASDVSALATGESDAKVAPSSYPFPRFPTSKE